MKCVDQGEMLLKKCSTIHVGQSADSFSQTYIINTKESIKPHYNATLGNFRNLKLRKMCK